MLKVTLKLTCREVNVLYCSSQLALIAWKDSKNRPGMVSQEIQLAEHYEHVLKQVYSWDARLASKEYSYNLSVSLTWAYHHWLSNHIINSVEQYTLLAKLDKALIDRHLKPQIIEHDN